MTFIRKKIFIQKFENSILKSIENTVLLVSNLVDKIDGLLSEL